MATFVRLLDVLSTLLLIDVAAVAAFGPWRVEVGSLKVSPSSWGRLLALALLMIAVRHVLVRQPTLIDRLRAWVRHPLVSAAGQTAWSVCISTRLAVLFIGLLATFTIGFPHEPPFRVYPGEVRNLPARWDAGSYLDMAVSDYWFDQGAQHQTKVAFFPAFPYAMRLAGAVLGASPRDATDFHKQYHWRTLYAGVLLSIGAFFWALVYLYKLASESLDAERAALALALLAAYPFAVFYSAPYTESFFLLAAVGAIYHLRREEYVAAAFWALLVGLTGPSGFLLSVPLALLALGIWDPFLTPIVGALEVTASRSPWRVVGLILVVLLPLAGVLLFSYWMHVFTSRPYVWAIAHEGGSFKALSESLTFILQRGIFQYLRVSPFEAMNIAAGVFALALIWPVGRRLGWAFAALVACGTLSGLAGGGPLPVGRMTAVCFPLFLYLAGAIPPLHRFAWLAGFALMQAVAAVLFFTWREFV